MGGFSELLNEALPHGAGMRLIGGVGSLQQGWVTFPVRLEKGMSVFEEDGTAPPELGLEIMAQACGMLLGSADSDGSPRKRRGVVGAVRGYDYETTRFSIGQQYCVRVKEELLDSALAVCEAELLRASDGSVTQRARITVVLMEDRA